MRNRLVISIVLGALLALGAAGAVGAQQSDVSVDLPGGSSVDPGSAVPACSNLGDDDGDGAVDMADPGCSSPLDGDEGGAAPPPTTTTTTPPTTTTTTPPTTTTTGPTTSTTDETPPRDDPSDLPGHNPFKDDDKGGRSFSGTSEDGGGGSKGAADGAEGPNEIPTPEIRRPDGTPTNSNPTVTIGTTGAAPIGVPNFVIEQFSIPPFLLPIYQACGTQYGVPWEVLASINRIETAFGTNLNVSTAGALGWMQFMPATWEMYGVDANSDGRKDPYNPVDAICAAARYLKAAGAEEDLYQAIFAYNHADWYVDEVLLYAKQYGNLPSGLVDSLTGLTEGAHFPVAAKSRYADDISERDAIRRAAPTPGASGNAADVVSDSPTRRGIDIYAKEGAPVVAANDGIITRIGHNKRLGRFIVLRDAYGNEYTYAGLGKIAKAIPVPEQHDLSAKDFNLVTPGKGDAKPKVSASETTRAQTIHDEAEAGGAGGERAGGNPRGGKPGKRGDRNAEPAARGGYPSPGSEPGPTADSTETASTNTEDSRDRLFALPRRKDNGDNGGAGAGRDLGTRVDDLLGRGMPGYETFKSYFSGVLRFDAKTMDTAPLRKGSRVVGGTIIGEVGQTDPAAAPHLNFAITPAGRGAHTIDPKPILDGWKLLEATAIYRAAGKNPFDDRASVGEVLLASKSQLQRQVLADPRIEIYSCGRSDVATGQIDRRILAVLEYLVARGYRLTITSLKCGHSIMTTSGNVSAHSTGDAVDIAMVNGIPIYGNQGSGSITEAVINDLLQLQGAMEPAQIISLMNMGGPTFSMPDHDDHIHVGYTPDGTDNGGEPISGLLKPKQWDKLLDRISELDQPTVPIKPSQFSLPTRKGDKAGNAPIGE